MKKSKKSKIKKLKYLVDTSIQITRFRQPYLEKELTKLSQSNLIYTSYYVFYEFKAGIIKNLIDYYLIVKNSTDIASAFSYWSDRFRPRELKNKLILDSIMANLYEKMELKNKDIYLIQVESVIFHLLKNFLTNITGIIGDFSDNEILKFNIDKSEYYEDFQRAVKANSFIKLEPFLKSKITEIQTLANNDTFKNDKKLEKLYQCIKEISLDLSKANTHNVSKSIGDAIITLDCPLSHTLVTTDHSFEVLCTCLSKPYMRISKDAPVLTEATS